MNHLKFFAKQTRKVRPKCAKPLEKEVEKAIRQAFERKHRITLFKTDAGGAGMRAGSGGGAGGRTGLPSGFPDLLGVIPGSGRVIVIEVKQPGKKPTEKQLHFIELFNHLGGVSFWANSVDSALQKYEDALKENAA